MVRIETGQLIPADPSSHHWDVIDIGLGHHRPHRRRDIAGAEFVERVLFPQRLEVVMRPHRSAQQGDRARMRETRCRLVKIRAVRSREPAADTRIQVCRDVGRSCKGSLNPLDRLCRNIRVVLREMHDEWAIDARSEIECSVNSRAVIGDCAIGTGPSRSEIGKLPAVAKP
jgi:hypothetical protein